MVLPRIAARTNRDESEVTVGIGKSMSTADEVGVERSIVLVDFMPVPACGIGLPDLDECVGHGPSVFVQHTTAHDDALAERFAAMWTREVAGLHIDHGGIEDRTSYLGERMREIDEAL